MASGFESTALSYALSLRYGITEPFEVRTALVYRGVTDKFSGTESKSNGLAFWNVGFQWNVIDGKGSGPALAFQNDFQLNGVGAPAFRTSDLSARTLLLFATPLTSWLSD